MVDRQAVFGGSSSHEYSAHSGAGGQEVSDAGVTLLPDVEDTNTSSAIYVESAGELTVNRAGNFVVSSAVSAGVDVGGGAYAFMAWLEVDSGSGFQEVAGTRSYEGTA